MDESKPLRMNCYKKKNMSNKINTIWKQYEGKNTRMYVHG